MKQDFIIFNTRRNLLLHNIVSRSISLLIVTFIIVLFFPLQASAVDYSIEQMTIDAYLQADGDIFVEERMTYDFDSSFNGMIRTLHAKEHTNISSVEAKEENAPLQVEKDGNDYLIHRQGEEEQVTVHLTYTIEKGVELHEDVGQFYWSFFDENNPSDYEQLVITVHPPVETTDVIALGDGSAEGLEKIEKDGSVQYNFGSVASGESAAIRIAYEAELFPQASLFENKEIRDQILQEEKKRAEAAALFAKRQKTVKKFAPYIVALFVIYVGGLFLYARQKKRQLMADLDRRFPKPFFIPEQRMSLPATTLYIRNQLGGDGLVAALLDLGRKGYVKQADEDVFVVAAEEQSISHAHEAYLISWLFYTVGEDGTFKFSDLESYTKKRSNRKSYYDSYTHWQKLVREEMEQHELQQNNFKQRVFIGLSSLLLVPGIVYSVIYEVFIATMILALLFLVIVFFALFYHPRTILGQRIKRDWEYFEQMYEATDVDTWESLAGDEQKRAFIYGLGTENERILEKNKALAKDKRFQPLPHIDTASLVMLTVIASTQFNEANKVSAAASSSATSAAGSGAGVGGSGGGSGAF